jgi:transcriptional regulator with XRE-family HTH domain
MRRRDVALLGDRIATRRNELGLKQEEVAERLRKLGLKISPQTVSAWEWGRPRIAVEQWKALAVALECTVTYLFGLTEDPHKWDPDQPMEETTRV